MLHCIIDEQIEQFSTFLFDWSIFDPIISSVSIPFCPPTLTTDEDEENQIEN